MSTPTASSPAEICDRYRITISAALLAIGIASAADAAAYLLGRVIWLKVIEFGAVGVGVVLIVGGIFWKTRSLGGRHGSYLGHSLHEQGFVAQLVTRAHMASWATTFVLLSLIKIFSRRSDLPAEFFLQLVLAIMLLVHGTFFFSQYHKADQQDA